MAIAIAALSSLIGCASDLARDASGAGFRHKKLGYSIAAPGLSPTMWQSTSLDGADLAYRAEDGSVMSLASSCKESKASPHILARRLLIGTSQDALVSSYPIAHRGDSGWAQTVDHADGDVAIRIKTVTVVANGCVFDWVYVAANDGAFARSVDAFDQWWPTFEWTHRDVPGDAP